MDGRQLSGDRHIDTQNDEDERGGQDAMNDEYRDRGALLNNDASRSSLLSAPGLCCSLEVSFLAPQASPLLQAWSLISSQL